MLPQFELYRPKCLQEACELKGQGAMVFAGGTDVFVAMHGGRLRPKALVDVKGIGEMQGATFDEQSGLNLGALTTHRTIEEWDIIKERYYALFEGCSQVGSVQIRHRGTLGGNICNAAPSADSVGPLLVFDAKCVVAGKEGQRTVPLSQFFAGPKKTVLAADELLSRIVVPPPAQCSGSAYIKYTRRKAMDLALLGVCVYLALDGNLLRDVRIALSTAAPTPIRAYQTEAMLRGKSTEDISMEEMGKQAAAEASPRSSWRANSEFRLKLLEELTQRAFSTALARAGGDRI